MGNRTNSLGKTLTPSSLARSDPTPDRPRESEAAEQGKAEPGSQAKSTIIKVLGSPQHVRKNLAPPQPLEVEAKSGKEAATGGALNLQANSNFSGALAEIKYRPARAKNKHDPKRGSIGPGSRSPSRERDANSSASSALQARNAAIEARELESARQDLNKYKTAVCALFKEWDGKPELKSVDSFLALETEPIHYFERLFAFAKELEQTRFSLEDVMSCGAHFLSCCRHQPNSATIPLNGTTFEGHELAYYKHLNSFFKLASVDLNIFELEGKGITVGNVVDFRDSEVSQSVTAILRTLQKIHEKIDAATLFDDF